MMNRKVALAVAFAMALGPAQAQPVVNELVRDIENPALAKLDRTVVDEPAYRGRPQYCLVVFGAKAATRIWIVVDGETVYVDRSGAGAVAKKGEKFTFSKTGACELGDVVDVDAQLKHERLTLLNLGDGFRIAVTAGYPRSKVNRLYGFAHDIKFAAKPADAPIVHFGGALSMAFSMNTLKDQPVFLCPEIGTPGLGKGSFVYYTKEILCGVGSEFRPQIEFVDEKKASATPFFRDSIEKFYWYPTTNDTRTSKVVLSMPDLWAIDVAPRTYVLPIVRAD